MNSGAAPLTKDLVDAVYKRLKIPVKQGYGLTETSPTTHTQPWEDWDKTIGSVGRLLPNQTAKYIGEDGVEVPAGETVCRKLTWSRTPFFAMFSGVNLNSKSLTRRRKLTLSKGELWITGPNIFLGYLRNEEGTKNALTEDGYFKTGDVGHQDSAGNFYITDRAKELLKYKGFQVPPSELEGYLITHPDIDDVAVIGIYVEEQATEVPRAYVVPKKTVQVGKGKEKEIQDWLAEKVANHKRLRGGVRFVDEIPKSAAGKILRRVLKAQALEADKKGVAAKLW